LYRSFARKVTQPPLKFGLFFFDYDLDGRLDLLLANGCATTGLDVCPADAAVALKARDRQRC
jgi:hypothetical protein